MVDDVDQFQVFFIGQRREQVDGVFDGVQQVERHLIERELAGFDATPLQPVIDQGQQRLNRSLDLQHGLGSGRVRLLAQDEVGSAQDRD